MYATQSKGDRNMGVPTKVLFILADLVNFSSDNALLTPKSANLHMIGFVDVSNIFSGLISLW